MDGTVAVALGGNIILFASVVLLGLQVREMNRQSRVATSAAMASVYQEMNNNMLDVDRLFIDRPELRPYFYDGKDPLPVDGIEGHRIEAAVELFVDMMDNVVTQLPALPTHLAEPWHLYFVDVAERSPALCEFWRRRGHLYSVELQRVLDGATGRL